MHFAGKRLGRLGGVEGGRGAGGRSEGAPLVFVDLGAKELFKQCDQGKRTYYFQLPKVGSPESIYHPGQNRYKIIPWNNFLSNHFCDFCKMNSTRGFSL